MMRRVAVILVEAAAFLLGALLILAAVLVWRLSQGPVDVNFLTPYVEDAAVDEPLRLNIGRTELRWAGFESPITLAATDVAVMEVEERGGAVRSIARFPEVEIAVAWPPLFQGRIVPTRLTLARPSIWGRLNEQGDLGFGFSDDADADEMPAEESSGDIMGALADQLMASPQEGGRSVLTEIEISDGRLIIVDEMRDITWRGTDVSGSALRQLSAVNGVFEASLETSKVGSVGFAQGSFSYSLAEGTSDVQLILDGIEANSLADVLLPDEELPEIDVPVKGVLAANLAPDRSLNELTFDIEAENGSIAADGTLLKPLAFDRIGAAGRFTTADQALEISAITLQADPLDAVVSGTLSREGEALTLAASVTATELPVDRFEIYWPKGLLPSVRNWVVLKTYGGTIETIDAAGQMRFANEDGWTRELVSLDGQFTGTGLNLNPLLGLPPIRNIVGTGRFDANGLHIESPSATSLDAQLSEGKISITGFGSPAPDVDIEFVVAGSLSTGLYYLNRPRLRLIDKLGIPTDQSDGRVAGRVRLRFPIVPNLTLSDVSAIAAANIRDGIIQLNPRWQLERTSATLSVDQASINLDGNGDLAGVPVSFSARRLIDSDEQFDTQVRFEARVEADRLPDFGIPPIPSLFGPIDVSVSLREGGNTQLIDLEADLAEAGLAISQIDWAKPVGEAAALSGSVRLGDWKPIEITDFSFDGAGLALAGFAAFETTEDDDSAILSSLEVSTFTLGENDLRGTIARQQDGKGWQVVVSGKSLSMRPLLRRVGGGGVGSGGAPDERRLTDLPVMVQAQIDTVVLGDERMLERAKGDFFHNGERWEEITLSGVAIDEERQEEASISARYSYELIDDRNFRVTSNNFGTLLNALNITDQVLGGEMALTARLAVDDQPPFKPSDPAMEGEVKMTSYSVVRAPAMAQLLVALSLNGLRGSLDEEGILFNGLEAEFTFDNGVLTVANGETGGSGLGLTLEGTLDTNQSFIDMDGTIVPIRGINRLLNQVPVLGELLGGKDEGLFAFTYKVNGPLDDPEASVNPISVLAPGVLREIFRFDATPEGEREEREDVGESG